MERLQGIVSSLEEGGRKRDSPLGEDHLLDLAELLTGAVGITRIPLLHTSGNTSLDIMFAA